MTINICYKTYIGQNYCIIQKKIVTLQPFLCEKYNTMKRLYAFILLVLVSFAAVAQSYGIMVNDKDYYAGAPNPSALDPAFQEFMVLNVSLKNNDKVQLYDAANKAGWAVKLDNASVSTIVLATNYYNVTSDGCYDFYIKLQYENDQLYVGEGKDCGNGGSKPTDPTKPVYSSSAPAQYPGVMLQAFYWDSYSDKGYGRTKWTDLQSQAAELGQWFDLIWLPPSSKSSGGTGYIPQQYSNQSGQWGSKDALKALINTFHENGARVVADIVVNHVGGKSSWCDFYTNDFGAYGKFSPTPAWICKTDEMNFDSGAGGCKGKATGANDDGYGEEANYGAARDWDHQNAEVRNMCKAYLKWLRSEIGYDGFRYDYCKGFHNSHINDYNSAAKAFFSVMEYWDGNPDVLQSRLTDAGWNTCTFDFGTKYEVFNNGIAADNYNLKGKGLLGRGKGRYAVTFVDSHDSFQRDDNEFCGKGNSMKYKDKLMQCNAYLLSMPGTPCVFYPHWVTFKEDMKKLINARYKAGVHNESAVSDESGNGYYKATITGTNGEIRLLLGPNSGYASTPAGYTLAAKGTNWGVYYKTTSARDDKNKSRTPVISEDVEYVWFGAHENVVKTVENGQLILQVGDRKYDVMGRQL